MQSTTLDLHSTVPRATRGVLVEKASSTILLLEQSPCAVRGERKRKRALELLANSNLADFFDPDFAAMRSSIFY